MGKFHRGCRIAGQIILICRVLIIMADVAYQSPQLLETTTNTTAPIIAAKIDGHIIIGGLFPIHHKGEKGCGAINSDRGIERLEAFLFTIDEINNNTSLLPGITLGASAFDTCGRAPYALEQSLEFIRASISNMDPTEFYCSDGSKANPVSIPTAVAGVVGGSYSTVSIQVANLLRLFKIPQISYASTSASLSDKGRYDYFVRTVPPDDLQAKALADIVAKFNWTYVSAVHSEGEYGEPGIDQFKVEAKSKNICIAADIEIPITATNATYEQVLKDLQEKHEAKVVIVFVRTEDALGLLNAATRLNVTGKLVWIASDAWGNRNALVKNNALAAQGAITLELQSSPISKFEEYFLNLNPRTNRRNPWFVEYWEEEHKCAWNERHHVASPSGGGPPRYQPTRPCQGDERLTRKLTSQESKIQFIYDAVYAFAHALDRMNREWCPGYKGVCPKMKKIDGEKLKDYLLNVSFDNSDELLSNRKVFLKLVYWRALISPAANRSQPRSGCKHRMFQLIDGMWWTFCAELNFEFGNGSIHGGGGGGRGERSG
ncbi:Metabotropic glutamate receptor 3 [Bulinus truncatus]|nr:Metabotropic glutamate receptor 3 [Bulinus truncatus]